MPKKANGKKTNKENPEFERVKDAFKQILSVPKEQIDAQEKRRSKPSQTSEKDCN